MYMYHTAGSTRITLIEFLKTMSKRLADSETWDEDILSAFNVIDIDKNGYIR